VLGIQKDNSVIICFDDGRADRSGAGFSITRLCIEVRPTNPSQQNFHARNLQKHAYQHKDFYSPALFEGGKMCEMAPNAQFRIGTWLDYVRFAPICEGAMNVSGHHLQFGWPCRILWAAWSMGLAPRRASRWGALEKPPTKSGRVSELNY
jgi:hypothetical protein